MLAEGKSPPEYRSTSASVTITLRNGAFDRPFAGLIRQLSEGGVMLDRNFPHLYPEHTPGAGRYVLSEPSALALAQLNLNTLP